MKIAENPHDGMISSGKNNISKAIASASKAADDILATYMKDSYDKLN